MDRNVLNWFVIIFIYWKCQNLESTWPWLFCRRHPAIWRPVVYWMDWATSINRRRKFGCKSRSNFANKLTKQECILVGCVASAAVAVSPATHTPSPCHACSPYHAHPRHAHTPCYACPLPYTPLPCTPPCHTRGQNDIPSWKHYLSATTVWSTTVADGKRRDWYLNSWRVKRRNKTILDRVCQEFSTFCPLGFWWQLINNWSWRRMKVLFNGQEQLHCANLCLTFCTRWTSKNGVA